MYWGHVVIEGYCDLNDECGVVENLPCSSYKIGKVAHYCLDAGGHSDDKPNMCKHFGWCKASDYIVATDSQGIEKYCIDRATIDDSFIEKIALEQKNENI